MKTRGMIINTLQNTVSYGRRIISGTEEPVPLSTVSDPVSPSEGTQETLKELHHTTLVIPRKDRKDIIKVWKNINVTVCGDYEILDRVAAPIRIRVPDAPVGGHVCLGYKNIKRLAIEPTISSVKGGQVTVALVVNTTGSPTKIKHGLSLL